MGKILFLIGCYFLGAIPFGLIISQKFYQVDIRTLGSGNPGATNVWRVLGKKPGIATLALDILKGIIPVVLSKLIFSHQEITAVLAGMAAISGHNWSVFLKGKGGKGVATSAGVFLALIPIQAILAVVAFAIVLRTTQYVSVGSITASLVLFISTFFIRTSSFMSLIVFIAATMVVIKHIPNMKRLARGEENKVKFK